MKKIQRFPLIRLPFAGRSLSIHSRFRVTQSTGMSIMWIALVSFALIVILSIYASAESDTAKLREEVKKKMRDRIETEKQEIRKAASESGIEGTFNEMENFRKKIRDNRGWLEVEGKSIRINEMSEEKKEIIAGKINAKTGLNLTGEDIDDGKTGQILRAYLSNGRYSIVKVMPDKAADIALKRLRAKCGERNCSIELKEVKIGNKSVAGYEVDTEKNSKILFIFNKKIKVRAVIDSETGEILMVKKPWWSFLAREKDIADDEIEAEIKGEDLKKVTVCHIPSGNESLAKTIKIGQPALEAHLAHGDYEGECNKIDIIINQTDSIINSTNSSQ